MSERALELFREHLSREREKYLMTSIRTAAESNSERDYAAIIKNAKVAEVIASLIKDLRILDNNVDEFVQKYLT